MCLLLRATNLKSVFVVRIPLKRRVFKVFKPGKKFKICVFCWLREEGRWKKKIKQFMVLFLCVFLQGAGRPINKFFRELGLMGVAVLLDARTLFDGHEVEASAVAGRAGWCEDTVDDSVHASENSVVAGVAASTLRELDVAVAAARCGEHKGNGHLLEFRNSLLAAGSGYSLHCLNSPDSLICHPSMHALSFASGLFVETVGVVGVERFCEGDTGVARWLGTARVDGLLHAGIQSVSACPNSRIRGHTNYHGSSCGQLGSSPNSRVVRGPGLRGGTKGQGAGEKLACFCSATVWWGACRDVGRW